MTKKQYIISFLDKVKDIREPARGFVVLVRYEIFNDQQIEELFGVFKSVVETTLDYQKKHKLKRAIATLEHIKHQEQNAQTREQDLDKILTEV